MALCPHTPWLDLYGLRDSREWSITYGQRLHIVLRDVSFPATKFPTVFFFVGKKRKVSALQDIFPNNNITRRKAHGIASLHLDTATAGSRYPLLFADCNPDAEFVNQIGKWDGCHESVRYRVNVGDGAPPTSKELADMIHAQLFLDFVDVVCLFADDLGGHERVADRLMRWAQCRQSAQCVPLHKPSVIVVASSSQARQALSQAENTSGFRDTFASLAVVNTADCANLAVPVAQTSLRGILLHEASKIREHRLELQTLYNAKHLTAFFMNALKNFATGPVGGFDFIDASRRGRRGPHELVPHMRHFLSLAEREEISEASVASFIASALLMDCYPAGMHLFSPDLMFDRYYAVRCLEAVEALQSDRAISTNILLRIVRGRFTSLFTSLEDGRSSHLVRREDMVSLAPSMNILETTRTCLFCIAACPEHVLACGHSICDVCLGDFGKPILEKPYYIGLSTCSLCLNDVGFVAREELATINPCILSIDGGGIKGIVALEFLCALQETLGPNIPLQAYFDLVVGTSSGAFIALDLFTNNSSVETSALKFSDLAQKVFPSIGLHSTSLCVRLMALLRLLFRDSRYNAANLEEVVKEVFGTTRILFGTSTAEQLGAKIAIMAAETSESRLCILTNYNKPGQRRAEAGYKHLRPANSDNEPFIWQVAMCTSAAPSYFPATKLPEFGPLHDGGVTANNPVEPGLWERKIIWPHTSKAAVILSVGTGYSRRSQSPRLADGKPLCAGSRICYMLRTLYATLFTDGSIPRLIRAFMASRPVHGQNSWDALMNHLDDSEREDYVRMNLLFQGEEPALDKIEQIPNLQRQVRLQLEFQDDRPDTARKLDAAQFFFELDAAPEYIRGAFRCRGAILCRLFPSFSLVRKIQTAYPTSRFMLNEDSVLGDVSMKHCCGNCGFFRINVAFDISYRDESVCVFLKYDQLFRRNINGFPDPISWFEDQQELNHFFGRTRYRPTPGPRKCSCVSLSGQKRKASFPSGGPGKRQAI